MNAKTWGTLISFAVLAFWMNAASAQFGEKWSTSGGLICDIGNTDADPAPEILVGHGYDALDTQLHVVDGQTGSLEGTISGVGVIVMWRVGYQATTAPWHHGPRLEDVDNDGLDEVVFVTTDSTLHVWEPGANGVDSTPDVENTDVPQLGVSHPNPTSGRAAVDVYLPFSNRVELAVVNVQGRAVRHLVNKELGAGRHTVEWDGRDDDGRAVASGVYFCRMKSAGRVQTQRLVRIH